MRTTVDIDDTLLKAARGRAVRNGGSLSEVVDLALRSYLEQDRRKPEPFVLVEAGREDGRFPSSAEIAAVVDEDDLARLK